MEQELSIRQLYFFLRRNLVPLIVVPVCATLLALYVSTLVTPQYKSKSTIEIKASYFKNPLVNDLISEVHDPAELRSQRNSMIQKVLSDEFLEELGQEFGLLTQTEIPKLRALERQTLRKSIEFYSMGPNTYELTVTSSPREKAKAIADKVVDRIITTLHSSRISHLESTRDAIQLHVRDLSQAIQYQSDDTSNQNLQTELDKVEENLDLLLTHFTPEHPSVQKLNTKARILAEQLEGSAKATLSPPQIPLSEVMASSAAKGPVKEVHSSLVKKLSDLSLVLSVERSTPSHLDVIQSPTLPVSAVFPQKRNFALFGALVGTLLAALIVSVRELGVFLQEDPEDISELVGLPLLGKLPPYNNPKGLLLLEGRRVDEGPKLLTWKS